MRACDINSLSAYKYRAVLPVYQTWQGAFMADGLTTPMDSVKLSAC